MLKVDNNILTTPNLSNYFISNNKGENNINQLNSQKDIYIPSNNQNDYTYSFNKTNSSNKANNTINKKIKVSENLPASSKFIVKTTLNQNNDNYPIEFTGNLTYQLVQYINKDIQKQIEILNKYNLSKVNRLIKPIEISQLV